MNNLRMERFRLVSSTGIVGLAALVAATAASAQEAASSASADTTQTAGPTAIAPAVAPPEADAQKDPASTELETIVVTAERRSQNVQRAAAAVTVRSGDDLRRQGRTTTQQILRDVPSINFLDTLNGGAVNNTDSPASLISIRGLRTNASFAPTSPSTAPSVAAYVDGVFNGLGGSYDIDRVEVLRGPQGTLYGRSATAGVLSTHTTDPSMDEFSGFALGEIGSDQLRHFSGAVNVPLGDTAALRVSFNHYERDGYYSKDGERLNVDDQRVKLLLKPTDNLTVLLGAAFQQNLERSGGRFGTLAPDNTVNYDESIPVGRGRDYSKQFWAQVDLDLNWATLTYIPAYRTYNRSGSAFNAPQGTGPGSPLISEQASTPKDHFLTQELRLASNGHSRFRWQTGLFYYLNKVHTIAEDVLTGGPFPPQGILLAGPDIRRDTENIGVFAEATYDLRDDTRVTAGLRYDYTRVQTSETSRTGVIGLPYDTLTIGGDEGKRIFRDVTYKLRLEHDLAPENLVYASVSSAVLPGDVGITTLVTDDNNDGVDETRLNVAPYEAEKLTSFEIGSKNQFLNNQLQVNGAVFYYIFGGHQRTVQFGSSPASQIPANTPARLRGAELEIQYRITPDDRFGLNFSYVDAFYVHKPPLFAQGVAQRKIAGVAPFSINPNYTHTFHVFDDRALSFRIDAQYRSKHYWTDIQQQNREFTYAAKEGDQYVVNTTVSFNATPSTLLSAYVNNIFDERYKQDSSTAQINPTPTSLGAARLTEPRTFGVLLQQSF